MLFQHIFSIEQQNNICYYNIILLKMVDINQNYCISHDQIKTGDVLLFSSNSATGFLLRTLSNSQWNHVGVAIRLIPPEDDTQEYKISLDEEGKLYILETNTHHR